MAKASKISATQKVHHDASLNFARCIMGGWKRLAEALAHDTGNHLTRQAVAQWVGKSNLIPECWVDSVVRVTEGRVLHHEIRPDLYGHDIEAQ